MSVRRSVFAVRWLVATLAIAGCAAPASPSFPPTATPTATAAPSAAPERTETPAPSGPPPRASATLPVRGDALPSGLRIGMTPAPDGGLYVSIPDDQGAVLARLDGQGRPRDGWPIRVPDSTSCGTILVATDGSVRVICDGTDLPHPELERADVRGYAFDPEGRLLNGWPVRIRPPDGARVIGHALTLVSRRWLTDTVEEGKISHEVWLTTIAADGTVRAGAPVPMAESCCGGWTVGPDGIAYTSRSSAGTSQIIRLDHDGTRLVGPLIDGSVSRPAFYPDGRIALLVGEPGRSTSRVMVVDPGDGTVDSTEVAIPTIDTEGWVDCVPSTLLPPIIAADETLFVYSPLFALDRDLRVMSGWPVDPGPLELPDPYRNEEGLHCPEPAIPAAGPDGTLLLPWMARDESIGGRLAALAPDGVVREGWPVTLKRPGAQFWSVVAGADATVHALAIEPEGSRRASATILAIAPDGVVRYRITLIDP